MNSVSFKVRLARWIIRNEDTKQFERVIDPFSNTVTLHDATQIIDYDDTDLFKVLYIRNYDVVKITIINGPDCRTVSFYVDAREGGLGAELHALFMDELKLIRAENDSEKISVQAITELIRDYDPKFRTHVRTIMPEQH